MTCLLESIHNMSASQAPTLYQESDMTFERREMTPEEEDWAIEHGGMPPQEYYENTPTTNEAAPPGLPETLPDKPEPDPSASPPIETGQEIPVEVPGDGTNDGVDQGNGSGSAPDGGYGDDTGDTGD